MGLVIISPGRENELVSSLYKKTAVSSSIQKLQERQWDIDVLGVEDNHSSHGENVYRKFK